MSQYSPLYLASHLENIKVELDLTNYATKTDLNNITHVDTSSFVLRSEISKLDIPKLSTVPADLAKLTKDVQEDFTKKTYFSALEKK